jgi:hypothetical protein
MIEPEVGDRFQFYAKQKETPKILLWKDEKGFLIEHDDGMRYWAYRSPDHDYLVFPREIVVGCYVTDSLNLEPHKVLAAVTSSRGEKLLLVDDPRGTAWVCSAAGWKWVKAPPTN